MMKLVVARFAGTEEVRVWPLVGRVLAWLITWETDDPDAQMEVPSPVLPPCILTLVSIDRVGEVQVECVVGREVASLQCL